MRIERKRADRQWAMAISGKSAEEVSIYLQEAETDRGLRDEINRAGRGLGRTEFVQIDAPFELYALTRLLKPDHIVEVGVSAGISSAYFLSALSATEEALSTPSTFQKNSQERSSLPRRTMSGRYPLGFSPAGLFLRD